MTRFVTFPDARHTLSLPFDIWPRSFIPAKNSALRIFRRRRFSVDVSARMFRCRRVGADVSARSFRRSCFVNIKFSCSGTTNCPESEGRNVLFGKSNRVSQYLYTRPLVQPDVLQRSNTPQNVQKAFQNVPEHPKCLNSLNNQQNLQKIQTSENFKMILCEILGYLKILGYFDLFR